MATLSDVQHDYLRYANCWEDAEVLQAGLQVQPGDRVLSIGSAGDNSFYLLSQQPELLVAIDINEVQLKLIALKKAAFQTLRYDEFLKFLGFMPSTNRLILFAKVSAMLSEEDRKFWKRREEDIRQGIVHQGKFEKYFQLFFKKILPLIHTRKRINQLFARKDETAQRAFYDHTWNNLRWRFLIEVFFGKLVMGRLGRDPRFLKEVKVPVAQFIKGQIERHLSAVSCQRNYFLHYTLQGSFQPLLPPYAREEHFESIKQNLDRLIIRKGYIQEAFEEYPQFDKFNLSNIFEYLDQAAFQSLSAQLAAHGSTGALYLHWDLMVPRDMSQVTNLKPVKFDPHDTDKGFFYDGAFLNIKP